MRLVLFSSNNCPPCQKVKDYFALQGVEYTTYTYENNPEYIKVNNIRSFPSVILYSDNGQPVTQVYGFNMARIKDVVKVFKDG